MGVLTEVPGGTIHAKSQEAGIKAKLPHESK